MSMLRIPERSVMEPRAAGVLGLQVVIDPCCLIYHLFIAHGME